MIPSHSLPGAVLFTNTTFPAQFLVVLLFGLLPGDGSELEEAAGVDVEEEELDEEESWTTLANSLTSFLKPWTLSEVPIMISMSGLRVRSEVWMEPMSSPNG